jgi:hypothetical protein
MGNSSDCESMILDQNHQRVCKCDSGNCPGKSYGKPTCSGYKHQSGSQCEHVFINASAPPSPELINAGQCKIDPTDVGAWGHTGVNFGALDPAGCFAAISQEPSCNKRMFIVNDDDPPNILGCYCFSDLTADESSCSEFVSGVGYKTYIVNSDSGIWQPQCAPDCSDGEAWIGAEFPESVRVRCVDMEFVKVGNESAEVLRGGIVLDSARPEDADKDIWAKADEIIGRSDRLVHRCGAGTGYLVSRSTECRVGFGCASSARLGSELPIGSNGATWQFTNRDDVSACEATCDADPRCTGFEYEQAVEGDSDGRCFFFEAKDLIQDCTVDVPRDGTRDCHLKRLPEWSCPASASVVLQDAATMCGGPDGPDGDHFSGPDECRKFIEDPSEEFVALLMERFPSYWTPTTSPTISTMLEVTQEHRPYGCYVEPISSASGVELQTRWNSFVGCDFCGVENMENIYPVCKARPRIPGNWYHGRCATKGSMGAEGRGSPAGCQNNPKITAENCRDRCDGWTRCIAAQYRRNQGCYLVVGGNVAPGTSGLGFTCPEGFTPTEGSSVSGNLYNSINRIVFPHMIQEDARCYMKNGVALLGTFNNPVSAGTSSAGTTQETGRRTQASNSLGFTARIPTAHECTDFTADRVCALPMAMTKARKSASRPFFASRIFSRENALFELFSEMLLVIK